MAVAEHDQADVYGPELEGFEYPFATERFTFPSQGQISSMTFMDVMPNKPNGHTVVLLHGKNFCAATWEATIKTLVEVGYRVIAPDQIGFCKSTKPEHYQYSFQQLAENTQARSYPSTDPASWPLLSACLTSSLNTSAPIPAKGTSRSPPV